MTHRELITYCESNGVEHKLMPRGDFEVLRVMDLSQLPGSMRDYFNVETGVYNKPLVAEVEKSPDEIPEVVDESTIAPAASESSEIVDEEPTLVVDESSVVEHQESGAEPLSEDEEPAELKGKLPDDFAGHSALDAAGIHTYGQLRKVDDLTEIAGIGEATALKIREALGE